MTVGRLIRALAAAALVGLGVSAGPAAAQNDWQSPDPYFGAFQHRDAGTPQAERRYRAEIAPQQPHRLHEQRGMPAHAAPRQRWLRHRGRTPR